MGGEKNQKWYQYHKYRYCNGHTILLVVLYRRDANSQGTMPKKRKAAAVEPAPKVPRGGGGRGAGRKATPVNAKGVDAPGAPKRTQMDLGDVFGPAFKKKNAIGDLLGARRGAGAGDDGELIGWDYCQHDGGEEDSQIHQRQRPQGRVQWDFEKEALARLIKKGPEMYYVDEENELEEVEETHPKAKRAERHHPPPRPPRPRPRTQMTRTTRTTRIRRIKVRAGPNNQNTSNTTFKYQYQYHSNLIKKKANTGMIPVNLAHCEREGNAARVRACATSGSRSIACCH